MANLFRPFFKEIRANLIYDVAKLVVLGAISMIVAGTYYLYRLMSGLPRDPVIVGLIFFSSFVLMAIAFLLARYGRKREQTPKATAPLSIVETPLNESKEDAAEWERKYWAEHNAATPIKTLNENYEQQIESLTVNLKAAQSDAKEARRERIAAESNLHGVETDRNNYRTWFNELAWLKPSIKEQAEDISNHVVLVAVRPCVLDLKRRYATIELVLRNDSLFDITIKASAVSGRFSTRTKGLLEDPAKAIIDLDHLPIKNLKPTKEATLAITQPLLKTEAEDIADNIAGGSNASFWIGNLNVPLSVENVPLEIKTKPLGIRHELEDVYFSDFGALTFNGEVTTTQELISDIDKLPFHERLRVYKAASDEYGASLFRLSEADQDKDPEDKFNESLNRRNTE